MFTQITKICLFIILILMIFLTNAAAEDVLIPSASFVDAGALDVAGTLAQMGGYDIVTSSQGNATVDKRVTIHIKDTPCIDAIREVLSIAGLQYKTDGRTILISTLPQDILSSANLDKMDKRAPQILIEASVVEISESGMEDVGIEWGNKAGSVKFAVNKDTGNIGLAEDFMITVNQLVKDGKAEVLASPRIVALDGHEALINIGSRIPYAVPVNTTASSSQWTVEYIDAGVSLKICPKVEDDGRITVLLEPEVSSISEWRATSAGEFPVITTRNAKTLVRVGNGETIMIGGLINRSERENISKIAVLGDIPIVGFLFQNRVKERAKTEVVFLVTPKII